MTFTSTTTTDSGPQARVVPSLSAPFNQAGAPNIADLGFDAQGSADHAETHEASPMNNDLIGFPGERVPHISFGFEGERWRIRNVVWVIGQSESGQKLLDHTYRAGYRIGFDSMVNTGERLTCCTNTIDRVIALDTRATAAQLVLMLTEALALASAAIDGASYDINLTPVAALSANRLSHAYALALQAQIAFELRTAPGLPANADHNIYWHQFETLHPDIAAYFEAMAINEMALKQGAAMAAAVRIYYETPEMRESADREVINFFRSLPASAFKDPKLMAHSFDAPGMAFKFSFPSISYACEHEPRLSLTSPANTGASATIAEAIALLLATRRNSGVKDREPWHISTV